MGKQIFDMPFKEFCEKAEVSGMVNRLPGMNRGAPIFAYSVFLNGDIDGLEKRSRSAEFKDVMVTALSRQLGMDPKNFRENQKVAELVAARNVWVEAVANENGRLLRWDGIDSLKPDVAKDFEALSRGMVHPYIQEQLMKQKNLGASLKDVLERGGKALGAVVEDMAPDAVTRGRVLAKNTDFLMQQTVAGEVVTHDNRRLDRRAEVGEVITVAYYKGTGQVVDGLSKESSSPYIDGGTGDVALRLKGADGRDRVVLFDSLENMGDFVRAHDLDERMIDEARLLLTERGEQVESSARTAVGEVYWSAEDNCLALDYRENGSQVANTAIFSGLDHLVSVAKVFGLTDKDIEKAREIERFEMFTASHDACVAAAKDKVGYEFAGSMDEKNFSGSIMLVTDVHVLQSIGRIAVIHDRKDLNFVPEVGQEVDIKYAGRTGVVRCKEREELDRGR